jgi:hypothetical protein
MRRIGSKEMTPAEQTRDAAVRIARTYAELMRRQAVLIIGNPAGPQDAKFTAALRAAEDTVDQIEAIFADPPQRPAADAWIIWFEDASMPPETFTGYGATEAARKRFDMVRSNWNCHLFQRVETDCGVERPAVDGLLDDLAKALEPFGAIADRYPKMSDDYPLWAARMKNDERISNQDFSQINHKPVVKVGDLRRARAALERYNAAKKEQA